MMTIKKKETMIHQHQYHQLGHSVERVGRCPKLTRYKVIAFLTVCAMSIFLLTVTLSRSGSVHYGDDAKLRNSCVIPLYDGDDGGDDDDGISIPGQKGVVINREDLAMHPNGVGSSYANSKVEVSHNKHLKRRLPSAIIIGARKAGTRALLRFLSLHPDVATSKREPHYFDRYYEEGLDWYRQQMPYSTENQITIEKTPNYFVDWDVPERVYDFNSSIKLLLIVRNPIDRAVSDYVQLKESFYGKQDINDQEKFYKNGNEGYYGSFEELAFDQNTGEINRSYAPIKRSLYCRHLEKWLNVFKMSQMHVVDGENIKVRPWEEMQKVEEFLGLSHKVGRDRFVYNQTKGFYCIKMEKGPAFATDDESSPDFIPYSERCLSASKGRDHPELDPRDRRKLRNFFSDFNRRFFTRTGITFRWN